MAPQTYGLPIVERAKARTFSALVAYEESVFYDGESSIHSVVRPA